LVSWCLLIVLGGPLLGGVAIALLPPRHRQSAGPLALVMVGISVLALIALQVSSASVERMLPGSASVLPAVFDVSWIPAMNVHFALRCDELSLPFLVNVLGVALAALVYGLGYLHCRNLHLCYALLLLFVGSMLGTLLADDVLLFFVFWEGMVLASSLLLLGWGEGESVGPITLKYLLYTQFGSLLLLVALIWLMAASSSSRPGVISERLAALPVAAPNWILALLLVGFGIKMGLAPFHSWLPDAHTVAPMPVTILLAAAMLSMGAYGLLRFGLQMLGSAAWSFWQLPVLILALASQVYGALMSLHSRQLKRIVAYSSVSQMGYILFGIATLTPSGVTGGVLHTLNHGILKALLFMGVGMVISATGRREIGMVRGLLQAMPAVSVLLLIGALAMAGVPPFSAFHSEWMILAGGLASPYVGLGYVEFIVPLLTMAYGLWFTIRLGVGVPPADMQVGKLPRAMRWSSFALIALALLLGLFPTLLYQWARQAMLSLGPGVWP
jgi:proton-translocating NADH-quinone oxidoreductase chain M